MNTDLVVVVVDLLKSAGPIGVLAFFIYVAYKVSMVGVITLGVYKALKLFTHRNFLEGRIAAVMGYTSPISPSEEVEVLEILKKSRTL